MFGIFLSNFFIIDFPGAFSVFVIVEHHKPTEDIVWPRSSW